MIPLILKFIIFIFLLLIGDFYIFGYLFRCLGLDSNNLACQTQFFVHRRNKKEKSDIYQKYICSIIVKQIHFLFQNLKRNNSIKNQNTNKIHLYCQNYKLKMYMLILIITN